MKKPKYGPKKAPRAIPIGLSNEFFRSKKNPAPDFWALVGYYVPKFNSYSCSAASVAMVLNAARLRHPKTSDEKVITQTDLIEVLDSKDWKDWLMPEGVGGEYGLTLHRLGKVVEEAFKYYGFKKIKVTVVQIKDTGKKTKDQLIKVLKKNEKSAKDFILANFNQQAFTDDADIGHIAPVGAFDAKTDRVLLFDPDGEYYEPYWVSTDTFLKGMATVDPHSKTYRGYVWIELQ